MAGDEEVGEVVLVRMRQDSPRDQAGEDPDRRKQNGRREEQEPAPSPTALLRNHARLGTRPLVMRRVSAHNESCKCYVQPSGVS